MTYDWPPEATIWRGRCVADTPSGDRCKRWRWITSGETPEGGWRCGAHRSSSDSGNDRG